MTKKSQAPDGKIDLDLYRRSANSDCRVDIVNVFPIRGCDETANNCASTCFASLHVWTCFAKITTMTKRCVCVNTKYTHQTMLSYLIKIHTQRRPFFLLKFRGQNLSCHHSRRKSHPFESFADEIFQIAFVWCILQVFFELSLCKWHMIGVHTQIKLLRSVLSWFGRNFCLFWKLSQHKSSNVREFLSWNTFSICPNLQEFDCTQYRAYQLTPYWVATLIPQIYCVLKRRWFQTWKTHPLHGIC